MDKIYSLILYCICLFTIIYPFSIVLSNHVWQTMLLLGVLILLFVMASKVVKIKMKKRYVLVGLFLLCLLTRTICVLSLEPALTQVSDFGSAFRRSFDLNFSGIFYRVFSHWILYPFLNHVWYGIFGASQLTALLVNCVVVSCIPIFLYLIGEKISGKESVGLCSAMLYILWPSSMFYVTIFTPDHYAALLLIIVTYLFLCVKDSLYKITKWKAIMIAILLGCILSISTFFKNFALVYLIAIFMILGIDLLRKKTSWKQIVYCGIYLFIIIASFFTSKELLFKGMEKITGNSIGRNIVPCYLNVGLNSAGNGIYNGSLYEMYFSSLEKNNFNFDETNQMIMQTLKQDLINNKKNFASLLQNKARNNFIKDDGKIKWVAYSINLEQKQSFVIWLEKNVGKWTNWFYLAISICSVIGILSNIKSKDSGILFVILCVLGVSLELLLVESQERYRYAIEPMFCLLAGLGCYYGSQKTKKCFQKKKVGSV